MEKIAVSAICLTELAHLSPTTTTQQKNYNRNILKPKQMNVPTPVLPSAARRLPPASKAQVPQAQDPKQNIPSEKI